MDKDTRKTTFDQLFKPIFSSNILRLATEELEADKYTKKLTTERLFVLSALAQLEELSSLRQMSTSLANSHLSSQLGLESISHSQISRRLSTVPTAVWQSVFKKLALVAQAQMGLEAVNQAFQSLHLIDSSTISMSLTQYPWAEFRTTKSGVKLHLRLQFFGNGVVPSEVVITPAKPADKTQMDNLVVMSEDAINVFDRAYVDYKTFDEYCEKDVRFVTRLKSNAVLDEIAALPTKSTDLIKRDCIVLLGKGTKTMKHPLRLVEVEDSQGQLVVILTNDCSMPAEEIADIYRYRWQIELFFKWIKQHMVIKHFYGHGEQSVQNQIYIALITYCLLAIFRMTTKSRHKSLLEVTRLLRTCLYVDYREFLGHLNRPPTRESAGRRPINHEADYTAVYDQVMAGKALLWDCLRYEITDFYA